MGRQGERLAIGPVIDRQRLAKIDRIGFIAGGCQGRDDLRKAHPVGFGAGQAGAGHGFGVGHDSLHCSAQSVGVAVMWLCAAM